MLAFVLSFVLGFLSKLGKFYYLNQGSQTLVLRDQCSESSDVTLVQHTSI